MADDTHRQIELISFEIAGQEFCIDISAVREIRGWTQAMPMPHTPDYLLGVINLRGLVMPVVDLGNRLGLGVTEASSRHVIVVVQHGSRTAGLLVDAVQETFVVDEASFQPPPDLGDMATGPRFVDAILPLEGRMLSRLVVGSLLPAQEREAA
ncbi:purine-binding chemotaxis protein CheW [Caulobacter ginsengisoli]|uniref:Purine-binding chemotaxis protein CheW n=1 Tax=Caulobacter ginsengisoli TaxID=400775 RepID=A0ABU0IY85_9CAUL|nr:chemotaxis protein CheW [Caulobacter ginsengisoli]MDQ0465917.1 purine-binding chemotaxis protein CheW [Caulobacter ginsengisoli]